MIKEQVRMSSILEVDRVFEQDSVKIKVLADAYLKNRSFTQVVQLMSVEELGVN